MPKKFPTPAWYFLILATAMLNSCSSHYKFVDFWSGQYSKDLGMPEAALSDMEKQQLQEIRKRGDELITYANIYREAEQEFRESYAKWNRTQVTQDWVLLIENGSPKAFFGSLKDTVFSIHYRLEWDGDAYDIVARDTSISNASQAMRLKSQMLQSQSEYVKKYHPKTMSIVLQNQNILEAYLIPQTKDDGEMIYGGALKGVYDTQSQTLQVDTLHRSSVVLNISTAEDRPHAGPLMTLHESGPSKLYNEVDYLQFTQYAPIAMAQYMILKNYPRVVAYWYKADEEPSLLILQDKTRTE